VQVDIQLESSTERGGNVTVDSVKTLKDAVPSANVCVWNPHSKKSVGGHAGGAFHAKCAVSDGRIAFITTANLSVAAMKRNVELGVLVKGGPLPDELLKHLEALVETEILILERT